MNKELREMQIQSNVRTQLVGVSFSKKSDVSRQPAGGKQHNVFLEKLKHRSL